jgi:hypothetical protein
MGRIFKQQQKPSTHKGNAMKKVSLLTSLTAFAMIAGSTAVLADSDDWHNNDSYYRDLYEIRQLHIKFHQAVSHAGMDATTRAKALEELLALWTEDGTLIVGGVTYSGKGTPDTGSCDVGALTLCDFYANHAGGLVLGHNWVSLTPIFTEAITVLDRHNATIYFQCIYLDIDNNDALKSNVTFGLPGMPARVKKVHGHWLFSYAESESIPPPTLDVDE